LRLRSHVSGDDAVACVVKHPHQCAPDAAVGASYQGSLGDLVSLPIREEFVECQSDVLGNLSQQYRGNVPPLVIGNRGDFPSRIAELLVRTTLPHLDKAKLEAKS
jgi:hypothetical protein